MTKPKRIGLDIVGFPCGKLGIGDQVRSLIKCALINGYDVNLIDCVHVSDNIKNDHDEYKHLVTNEFKHPVRIYSLTQNHVAALIYRFGSEFFDNENNIFQLAWEFDERPTELDSALRFCDEIWGISTFTSRAFINEFNIPVKTMHNAVDAVENAVLQRSDFNFPNDKFLFCFSFDFNSWMTRKNPMAVIEAFDMAGFKPKSVGLVIKVSNVYSASKDWLKFKRMIDGRSNVYVINETLDKSAVMSLFNCCDSYVSLHRCEGFGIGMAENMLLNKPVICTSFSGNMDFCNAENSYLVDYDIVKVKESEYDFSEGFFWAAPSTSSAAQKMKDVYGDGVVAIEKANKAKINITNNFSSKHLAKKFKALVSDFIERRSIEF